MKSEPIKKTISKLKNSLKIIENKRALILLALIKTDFNVIEAMKLNYPDKNKSQRDAYYKEILSTFPEGINNLKKRYKEECQK